jgi:hypothetical protein
MKSCFFAFSSFLSGFLVHCLLFTGFLESLGVFCYLKLVDAFLDVTVHEHRKVVHGPVDPVVRHAALGIIVGTDLGGTVTSGDHGLALGTDLVEIFLMLEIVETGPELLESAVLVLKLGTLLLALDDQSGRKVGQTYS